MNTLETRKRHEDQPKILTLEGASDRRRERAAAIVETGILTMRNKTEWWRCCKKPSRCFHHP